MLFSSKLTWLVGKSPFSIGNTSEKSWSIFQPAMLVYRRVFPFEHEDFPASHVSFQGCKLCKHVSLTKEKTHTWQCSFFHNSETGFGEEAEEATKFRPVRSVEHLCTAYHLHTCDLDDEHTAVGTQKPWKNGGFQEKIMGNHQSLKTWICFCW